MHRFFVPPELCRGDRIALGDGDRRHAFRVLRVQPGEAVEILDGAGTVHECRVIRSDRDGVEAGVLSRREVQRPPAIVLATALLKGKGMDFLVQKATELGVTRLQPLQTERSVVRISESESESKREGWVSTAVEACKQCGNPWLPRIDPPVGLSAFLKSRGPGDGPVFVAALGGQPELPGLIWEQLQPRPESVTIVTGPEGDLSEAEYGELAGAGALPFTLGPLVLRGETAAIASLAIFQHLLRLG